MAKVEGFLRPSGLDEALSILALRKGNAAPVAGSTAIGALPGLQKRYLMGLGALGLDGIEVRADAVRVGAMATISDLEAHEAANAALDGAFCKVAARLASQPLRNMITAGGNAIQVFPWSELPPLLLALDARFVLARKEGERVVDADAFYAQHPRTVRRPDELLVAIEIPLPVARVGWTRFSLAESDYALVTLAVAWRAEGARVAVGALTTLPRRLPEVEALLAAGPLPVDLEARIGAALPDPDASPPYEPAYRREVAAGLLAALIRGEEVAG